MLILVKSCISVPNLYKKESVSELREALAHESEQKSLSKVKVEIDKLRYDWLSEILWHGMACTVSYVFYLPSNDPFCLCDFQFVWSVTRFLTTALCCLRKRVSFLNMKLPIFNEMKLLTYYCGRRKNLEFRSFQIHSQKYLHLFAFTWYL